VLHVAIACLHEALFVFFLMDIKTDSILFGKGYLKKAKSFLMSFPLGFTIISNDL